MRNNDLSGTQKINISEKLSENTANKIIKQVVDAMKEKGYNPVNQIVGYILSGDPTYITSYKNARILINKIERDELLEEFVNSYLKDLK